MKRILAMILAAAMSGCLTGVDYAAEPGRTEGRGPAAAGKTSPVFSQNELNMLLAQVRRQITSCWLPPAGADMPSVRVRFALNEDGALASDPVVRPVNPGDSQGAKFQRAAESALRAVRSCTPLRLPAAQYDFWKDMEIIFDPREARGHERPPA